MNQGRNSRDDRLASMESALRHLLEVVTSTAEEHRGDFTEFSPAREEWEAAGDLQNDLQQAFLTGLILWHSISDHARSLADLIERRRTYAGMTIARALAEAAARSWYLLEADVEARDRVARMLNERLFASYEHEALLKGLLSQPSTAAGTADDRAVLAMTAKEVNRRIVKEQSNRVALVETARFHQIGPVREKKWETTVGVGRPSSMALLSSLLGHGPAAISFFRMNSAIAHTALHGQVRMIAMTVRDDGTHVSTPVAMDPDDLCAQAWVGVAATTRAAELLFRQAGWPTVELSRVTAAVHRVWNPPPDASVIYDFMDLFEPPAP